MGSRLTSRGPQFPSGVRVVQDGQNLDPSEHQDFKYVSWQAIVDELELSAGPQDLPNRAILLQWPGR